MHVGVAIFPTEYAIPMAELGRAAEERGFESLWVSEHSHIPVARRSPWPGGPDLPKMYYDTLDPFVALASAASVTSRIRLATGICLIVERDPIHTAKQVASLDRVSGGRFLFGIGAGWNLEEMENHGTRPETRFRLMRERVEAMKAIWSRDEAEYHGELVDFDPIYMWPKPIQAPHPPIHVGGGFPGGARRAIRYGDGWMPISGRDGDIAQRVAEFREMAAQAGRDSRALEISVFGAEPERAALVRYRDAGVSRAILRLPSAPRDEILPLLDGFASAMQSLA
jgi:probable F420-dependent oxidoreductase